MAQLLSLLAPLPSTLEPLPEQGEAKGGKSQRNRAGEEDDPCTGLDGEPMKVDVDGVATAKDDGKRRQGDDDEDEDTQGDHDVDGPTSGAATHTADTTVLPGLDGMQ